MDVSEKAMNGRKYVFSERERLVQHIFVLIIFNILILQLKR